MEVTFKVDLTSSSEELQKQANAINCYFNALLGKELKVVSGEEEETEEKSKPKTTRKKATPAKKKEVEYEEEEEDLIEVSFEELSTLVAEKIKKLKDAGKPTAPIVKKLKSYGVKKLDELEEENYGEMMAYLKKL